MQEVSNTNNVDNDEGKEVVKKSKVNPLIILVSILLIAVIIVGIILIVILTRKEETTPQDEAAGPTVEAQTGGGRGTVLTEDNVEEVIGQLNDIDPKYNQYTTKMNVDWVFDKWDVPSTTVVVENIERNDVTVYFDLTLQESGELIYSSPFIPAGSKLEEFALSKEVPAGVYPAVVTYHLVDENQNNVTELSVAVTLTILG